jgi:hypothetical protein
MATTTERKESTMASKANTAKTTKANGAKLMAEVLKGIPPKQLGKAHGAGQRRIFNKGGKRVAQVTPRATFVILEHVRGAKVGGLKEAGKGGRGRYVVTAEDVATARNIIAIALTWNPEPIEKSAAGAKAKSKPSGKRARSRECT